MELAGYQRKHLRGLAHELRPVVQIGRSGLTDEVVAATEEALIEHELIKISMRKPEDKKGTASALAERTQSELCGLIGHTIILYRAHPESPVIRLPKRTEPEPTE